MSAREFPSWMYRWPDSTDTRIAELEAALLESNDTAAQLREAREIPACRTCELRLPCPDHGEAE